METTDTLNMVTGPLRLASHLAPGMMNAKVLPSDLLTKLAFFTVIKLKIIGLMNKMRIWKRLTRSAAMATMFEKTSVLSP